MYLIASIICFLGIIAILICILIIIFVFISDIEPNLSRQESEKYFCDPTAHENVNMTFPSLRDDPTVALTVVVPAYNEEQRLPVMMDEAVDYLEKRQKSSASFTYEIIVVDDGSRDRTTEIALNYTKKYGSSKVRVLTLSKNRGKGGAVRMGMLSSRGRLLLFADADGATLFSDFEKLEIAMSKFESDSAVVCGSRAYLEKESIATRSIFRTFLMFCFHFLVWFLCVRNVRDTQCGFKLFSRPAARLLFPNLHVERWAFDVDLLHIAQNFKLPVAEIAVTWHEVDGSKLSPLLASLQMFRDLVLIRLRYLLGVWKMNPRPQI